MNRELLAIDATLIVIDFCNTALEVWIWLALGTITVRIVWWTITGTVEAIIPT
jgi:hypothetical protein